MKYKFRFPNTRFCFVVWFRDNRRHETHIETPPNTEMLKSEMLKHRVGFSEIRAVKSDPDSGLKEISVDTINSLQFSMNRV